MSHERKLKVSFGSPDPELKFRKRTDNYSDHRDPTIKAPLPQENSFSLGIVGGCGYGKTAIIRNLLDSRNKRMFHKKFDLVYYVCPNYDPWVEENIHPNRIFHSIEPTIIEEIKEGARNYSEGVKNDALRHFIKSKLTKNDRENLKTYMKSNKGQLPPSLDELRTRCNPTAKVLVILDDMISEVRGASTIMDEFFLRRRHTLGEHGAMSVICVSQVYNRIPLQYRKNIDYMMFFQPRNSKERNSIMEEILEGHDPRILDAIFQNISSDGLCHDFCYVDKRGKIYTTEFKPVKIEYV